MKKPNKLTAKQILNFLFRNFKTIAVLFLISLALAIVQSLESLVYYIGQTNPFKSLVNLIFGRS